MPVTIKRPENQPTKETFFSAESFCTLQLLNPASPHPTCPKGEGPDLAASRRRGRGDETTCFEKTNPISGRTLGPAIGCKLGSALF